MSSATPGTRDARRVLVGATVAFAALLVVGGMLILWARGRDLDSLFESSRLWQRTAIGALIGSIAAAVCALIVRSVPRLSRLRSLAEHAVEGIEPRWHTMFVIAVSAGVSEEFFFRGALEPVIGPWLTSLAFVAVHGALRRGGSVAFVLFLFAASTGLSALNAWQGLVCAMAAHAAYDLVMLAWLARPRPQRLN
jgi:hypothetical protein